jgi:imidazolonepropionase
VRATRQASEEELFLEGMKRLDRFLAWGVTTVEIKTGYGLDLKTEMKMLRVIDRLNQAHPVTVSPTLLAHKPPQDRDRSDFVQEVVERWLPAAAGLAKQFDVFCDDIAFSLDEATAMLTAAKAAGMGLRVHAEQLSHTGISAVAAKLGATSADHLDLADTNDLKAMAENGTTAVLLPGCAVSMGVRKLPKLQEFTNFGIPVALSTDYNPGSSVTVNLPLMGTLAVAWMGFSYEDAIRALTNAPARVLGMDDRVGGLSPGMDADFVVLKATDFRQVFYDYADPWVSKVYKRGEVVYEANCRGHGRTQHGT